MGAAGSKVYHIACAPYMEHGYASLEHMLGESGECDGWSDLNEDARTDARAAITLANCPLATVLNSATPVPEPARAR